MIPWVNRKFRPGNGSPHAAVATSGVHIRTRPSKDASPAGAALPVDPPAAGARNGQPVGFSDWPLLLWRESPMRAGPSLFLDYSWRWRKHLPVLSDTTPPSGLIGVDSGGAGVFVEQAAIAPGGSGNSQPYIAIGGQDVADLVDPAATPIWCIAINWEAAGPLQSNGTPPAGTSASIPPPSLPDINLQPIVGNTAADGPWLLYVDWNASWIGVPGAWTLELNPRLVLGHGSPRVTVFKPIEFHGGTTSQWTVVEVDNTNNRLRLYGAAGQIDTTAQPGGWPSSQALAASDVTDTFASYRQLNGNILFFALVPLTLEDTVLLLDTRSIVPGTGAPSAGMTFRAAPPAASVLTDRLAGFAHYWPLDDLSSPVIDLAAGTPLDVVNPSLATFGAAGVVNPLSPLHTTGLRLDRASDDATATAAYLHWGGTGTFPSLGDGTPGSDFTLSCWVRWEGPPARVDLANGLGVFESQGVPVGATTQPGLAVSIRSFAEPFIPRVETWDNTAATFVDLEDPKFDWPAAATTDSDLVPYKAPTWALLSVVLRTVGGALQGEIWMDGVQIAHGSVGSGWGMDRSLLYVAKNLAPCTIQHLTLWPFALNADELAGLSAT